MPEESVICLFWHTRYLCSGLPTSPDVKERRRVSLIAANKVSVLQSTTSDLYLLQICVLQYVLPSVTSVFRVPQ